MTPDLALVSMLEIGEQASLFPPGTPGAVRSRVVIASKDPAIALVDADGHITGQAGGSTVISVHDAGTNETMREMPLTVRDAPEPAPALHPMHPRLRFAAAELAHSRALIDGFRRDPESAFGPDVAAFFALADRYVDETIFVYEWQITGEVRRYELPVPVAQPEPLEQPLGFADYPFWTQLSRQIQHRMTTLSAAWLLTGDRRYAGKATAQLLALAGWSKWHEYDKATNNLSLPHFTLAAALAYDELYALLTEQERETVRDAIVRLGLRPMSHWLDVTFDHNITVLMNAGMLMGHLAIGDEAPFLDTYFHAPLRGIVWYLEQRETSHVTEGHVYTSYSMSNVLPIAAAVRRACGRDDLFRSPYLKDELLDFFVYFRGGAGGYANLSDSQYDSDPFSTALHLLNEFADPRAAWILSRKTGPLPDLVPYLSPATPPVRREMPDGPRSRHFERFDWAALRSGWNDDDVLLAFVSSPSDAGHNHFDQNHFVLNIGGEWLITDPGYQNYTPGPEHVFTNATLGHNGLLVNGDGQTVRGHGRIVASDLGDRFDYVVGDATAAYEGRLDRWRRHVVFAAQIRGYILIVDEIVPGSARDRIDVLFHTLGTVTHESEAFPLGAKSQTPTGFRFKGDARSVGLTFDADGDVSVRHEQFPGAERFGTWLSVTPETRSPMSLVTLLTIDPADTAPLRCDVTRTEAAIAITVDHAGGSDTHSIRLGGDPAWSVRASS